MLRLAPRDFWALSLREWRALVAGRFGDRAPALARSGLQDLMRQYPDG